MLSDFFIFLAQCVSLYSTLCLIRIILSWFPGVLYSPVGMFFSTVCDPFLNLFRRFRIFKNSPVDFSPIFAFAALSILQTVLSALGTPNVRITLGGVLYLIIGMIWSVVRFFINILLVIFIVRLIVNLMRKDVYSSFWATIDSVLNPILNFFSRFIPGRKIRPYRTRLIFATTALILIYVILIILTANLFPLLLRIPF